MATENKEDQPWDQSRLMAKLLVFGSIWRILLSIQQLIKTALVTALNQRGLVTKMLSVRKVLKQIGDDVTINSKPPQRSSIQK